MPTTLSTNDGRTLSARVQKVLASIQPAFDSFTRAFHAVTESRAELAPRFMKAFAAWQGETGGTFVAFVRVLDSSVPADRDAYRVHRSFMAADYLRRLSGAQATRSQTAAAAGQSDGPSAATPNDALARAIATMLLLIPEGEQGKVFDIIRDELGWSERQVNRLERVSEQASPLVVVKAPRGVTVPSYKVTAPTHTQHETTA